MHHLKFAIFQASWVTWWWDWFLLPEQIDSHSPRKWIGGEKEMFYFEMQCGCLVLKRVGPTVSEGICVCHKFSAGGSVSDTDMSLSSLLCSLSSFLLGGATTTLGLLPCANKQPMAYGAWGKVQLMLRITCSICLMIVREIILWHSFPPPLVPCPCEYHLGISIFLL